MLTMTEIVLLFEIIVLIAIVGHAVLRGQDFEKHLLAVSLRRFGELDIK